MAKIALIFLFAFCVFQISTAARIPRDVVSDDAQKTIDNTLQQVSQFLERAFTKENFEKVGATLKELGDSFADKGKELIEQADAGIKKLQVKE